MSNTIVNPQVTDAVAQSNNAVLGVAKAEGNGMAHQMVAQAVAMAIQDATEFLRSMNAISATTIGVATEILLSQPDKSPQATAAIEAATKSVNTAVTNFQAIGSTATSIISNFPSS